MDTALVSAKLRAGAVLAALLLAAIAVALLAGYPSAQAQQTLIDYDTNDNGLIEVDSLAKLDAIRLDLNGDGSVLTDDQAAYDDAFPSAAAGMGCPDTDDQGTEPGPCIGYELTAPLDMSKWNNGGAWTPIGVDDDNIFNATFQGNGKTISNLNVRVAGGGSGTAYAGLFGRVGTGGSVENVGIISGTVSVTNSGSNNSYAGGLVGSSVGRVAGSYAEVTVTAESAQDAYAGGLVGSAAGVVTNSYATGNVMVTDESATSTNAFAGGLVGEVGSNASVTGSHATGDVHSVGSTTANAGGLVGEVGSNASVTGSHATGDVHSVGSTTANAGGLVGEVGSNASVTGSHATGDVHSVGSTTANAGGLAGVSVGAIDDSYATGNVTAGGPGASNAGGLAGAARIGITGSYAAGDATATSGASNATASAGGLVGLVNLDAITVTASYATGAATATSIENAYAGGLIGNVTTNTTIRSSYATGNAAATGDGDTERAGGLVGSPGASLTIHDSYAIGRPSVHGSAGTASTRTGLVNAATVTASYWDADSSGVPMTADGAGKGTTTLALQAPTSTSTPAGNPYATWGAFDLDNADADDNTATGGDLPWAFGTDWQYPILVFSASTRNSVQRPTVTLSVSPASISENRGVAYLSASLDRPSNATTTLTVSGGSASAQLQGTTLTIWPDGSSTSVRITTTDDGVYTGNRTVSFSGQVQPGGAGPQAHPADAILTLTDDETAPPTTPGDGTAPAPTPEPTATPAPTATPIPVTVVPDSQITPVPTDDVGDGGTVHPDRSTVLSSGNVTVTFPPRSRPWSFQATLDTSAEACATAPNTSGVQLPCATVQIYDTSGSAESNVVLLAPAQIRIELTAEQVEALGGVVALYTAHKAGGLKLMVSSGDGQWREIALDLEITSSGGVVLTASVRRFSTFAVTADQSVIDRVLAALRGETPVDAAPTAVPSTAPVPTPPKVGGPSAPTALLLALLAAAAALAAAGCLALRPRRNRP